MTARIAVLAAVTAAVLVLADPQVEVTFAVLMGAVLAVAVAMTIVSVRHTVPAPSTRSVVVRSLGLAACTAVGLLLATAEVRTRRPGESAFGFDAPDLTVLEPVERVEVVAEPPGPLGISPWLAVALALLAAVIVAVLLWRWHRARAARKRLPEAAPVLAEPDVAGSLMRRTDAQDAVPATAVAALYTDLDDGDERRRAVIAAYITLERSLGASGHHRRPSDTVGEFVGRALADGYPRDEADIDALLAVFNRARFSRAVVTEHDVRTARDRLAGLGVR